MMGKEELRLDYEETNRYFRMLADIRFKLLAFVPTLAGAAVALLTNARDPGVMLAMGILGFVVTLGIVLYELRNTSLYDAAIHRAKWIEVLLDLPLCTQGRKVGGLFNERPGRSQRFLGLMIIWHDRALAIVYGAALGGWIYIAGKSLALFLNLKSPVPPLLSALLAGGLFVWEFDRISRTAERPEPTAEMKALVERSLCRRLSPL